MTMGTRDSRKIVGKYHLTGDDVLGELRCADSIGIFFQVPLGCCQPPNIENLLVAGRCVAGDRVTHAAVAAAVSLQLGVSTSDVDIVDVQRELLRQGVKLE